MSNKTNDQAADFESVKTRLAEIADAVDDESLSLDDALDLYEEAVALGLQASDLLEAGIVVPEEGDAEAQGDGESSSDAQDGARDGAQGEVQDSAQDGAQGGEQTEASTD